MPSGAIRYSCGVSSLRPSCSRVPMKAMRSPCGDHAGCAWRPGAVVSRRAARRPRVSSSHSDVLLRELDLQQQPSEVRYFSLSEQDGEVEAESADSYFGLTRNVI